MRAQQQAKKSAESLPVRSVSETCHYIPQFVLKEFRLGKNGRQKWLLYDRQARSDGQYLREVDDVRELFNFKDLYLWEDAKLMGDCFTLSGPPRTAEKKLSTNETKAAEIIRKISSGPRGAKHSLDKNERLHLSRFLALMCIRNPHFHLVLQKISPNPEYNALAQHTEGILTDAPPILRNCHRSRSLAALAQLEMTERICNVFLPQLSDLQKNCTIFVMKIGDPGASFITGSFPACPLQTIPDEKIYMWVPVTKKMALCYYFMDDPESYPSIVHVEGKKDTVRDINRFIFETSQQVLVQSEEHLKKILSAPDVRLHHNPQHKTLVYALSDTVIA